MDVRSLVNDARVLLAQLRRSQWGELHVRTPQGEIFIARHGGGPNPMRRVATDAAAVPPAAESTAPEAGHVVRAPHVGTVLAALPARTAVGTDMIVCRLAVLGEVIEVSSPHAGVVGEVFVMEGALVEYESPLVTVVRTQ